MPSIDLAGALRRAAIASPDDVPEILAASAADLGGTDLVVYLVDFGQTTLEPIPDRATHANVASSEAVGATMAGRAFVDQEVVIAERDDGVRVWVPIVEGSDRTGVLALSLPEINAALVDACTVLGCLAGYLIAVRARSTDIYNLYRRRRSMSLAASMQWDLLPPLVMTSGAMSVAGLVEPAYEVGGDCFDYADNGPVFDLTIMDAMGHGLHSAVLASLAIGTYRHDRREARGLVAMHEALGATLTSQYDDASFVTGILARIDTTSGELTWTNAGHPPPLLLRDGQVIGELTGSATPPWGLAERTPRVTHESLEPRDIVLLYTDGITDARTPDGNPFGLERLVDITQASASALAPPGEIVRRINRGVTQHQGSHLRDDATVVLAQWSGPPGRRENPLA